MFSCLGGKGCSTAMLDKCRTQK